jgi:hypothetical protein
MSRWRRILLWSGTVIGIIAIYLWFFGYQTIAILGARYLARDQPILWKVPVELSDLSISKSPGGKLSYYGYEFEVPWNDLDEQITRPVGYAQFIAFHSGKAITFNTIPPKESLNATRKSLQPDEKTDKPFRRAFSDYASVRAVLETTPNTVTLFTPRDEALRTLPRLLLKAITMGAMHADTGVFWLRTKEFRGFQYGDPRSSPHEIVDDLFVEDGRIEFTFAKKSNAVGFSQSEINRVIQTVRRVPDHSASADSKSDR